MAADSAENWGLIGQIVLGVLGTIGSGFLYLYSKSKKEGGSEDVVQKSVGAAFVDHSVAQDLRSIAEDTRKIREIAEDEEARFREKDLIEKALDKLRQKEAIAAAGSSHRRED